MTKIQKRLVGLSGLALVAAVTTVAINIPDANAESATGTVNINFTVVPKNPSARFESPENNSTTTNPNVSVKLVYSNAEEIIYTLTRKGVDGAADQTVTIPSPAISETLTHLFAIDLNAYFGTEAEPKAYGNYVLKATVKNGSATPAEDSVSFTYKASDVCVGDDCPCEGDNCPNPDCEGDDCPCVGDHCNECVGDHCNECVGEHCIPKCEGDNCKEEDDCFVGSKNIIVKVDEDVDKVIIILYDKAGNEVYRKTYKVKGGQSNVIKLSFKGYCLKAEPHKVAIIPVDPNGPIITEEEAKKNAMTIDFSNDKGQGPSVPNTGDFLSNLNISNSDFLITGLIGFVVAAVLGFVLLNKKAKRN